MTDSLNRQWLVFGWPLNDRGERKETVDASLYEPADDGGYLRTMGTVPAETVEADSVGNFEVSPGVLALHQAPPARQVEILNHVLDEDAERKPDFVTESPRELVQYHTVWNVAEFVMRIARSQRSAVVASKKSDSNQHSMTDREIARELSYRVATYFGFDVRQEAEISWKTDSSNIYEPEFRLKFESPIDVPSLVRATIELDEFGIDLALSYRFGASEPWHEFCDDSFDGHEGFYLHNLLKALLTELTTLVDHGLTQDETLSYLAEIHDVVERSEEARSHLEASDTLSYKEESITPKLRRMFLTSSKHDR